MKSSTPLSTTCRGLRGALLCACLWVLAALLPQAVMGQSVYATPYTMTTLAGKRLGRGTNDGTGAAASFAAPFGIAMDSTGNLYVADAGGNAIRKVTPEGVVTTIAGVNGANAGTNDGTGSAAQFYQPQGIALDSSGNLYVADNLNYTIREITPVGTNWVVTTIAGQAGSFGTNDGIGSNARFNQPWGIAVNTNNGKLYVGDVNNGTIREVTPVGTNWVVTTIAGQAGSFGTNDGTGSNARFFGSWGLAVDNAGNVFVAEVFGHTVRRLTPDGTNWVVTTLAGQPLNRGISDGMGSAAMFNYPQGIVVDSNENIYVADTENALIRRVAPVGTNWIVTTLAGLAGDFGTNDGTGSAAWFFRPNGVAVDIMGNVYITDGLNENIRKGYPPGSIPQPFIQAPSLNSGQLGFGITGLPNLAVDVQSSGNLSNWQMVGTNYIVLVGGSNFFTVPSLPEGNQFYRAHVH